MKHKICRIVLICLLASPLMVRGQDMKTGSLAMTQNGIEAGNSAFMKAWEAGNARGVAALYTNDAHVLAPGSEMVDGPVAIAGDVQKVMNSGATRIRLQTLAVDGQGGMAVEMGKYELLNDSGEQIDHGKYIVYWKRIEGVWKLHWDIYNSSVPPESGEMDQGN